MKLDRNINIDGSGKYAIVNMRALKSHLGSPTVRGAIQILEDLGIIDYGRTLDSEFFVVKTKDKNAGPCLRAYEAEARKYDEEYADEVGQIALNAETHPRKQKPD